MWGRVDLEKEAWIDGRAEEWVQVGGGGVLVEGLYSIHQEIPSPPQARSGGKELGLPIAKDGPKPPTPHVSGAHLVIAQMHLICNL